MIRVRILLLAIVAFTSCNWAKEKAKKTVNHTGEMIAKTGSEFGEGVYKGVQRTFENDIKLADHLKAKGFELGKMTVGSADSATDNMLTAYIIFNDDFDSRVSIRLLDEEGKEYGRLSQEIKGKKGAARYVDFIFDKRVDIGIKGAIIFE
jgi:hypothetical protein